MIYDVAVVGAGVVGGFIARELSRYKLKICLIEKESDVGTVTSSANSGIVHAGYDAEPGSLKACLNVRGNEMMDCAAKELDVPFNKTGSLVIAFDEEDMHTIGELYEKGLKNGVPGLKVLSKGEVKSMEPNISENVVGALYAPTAGVICPYELSIGAVENAVSNGVDLKLDCKVLGIKGEKVFKLKTSKGEMVSRFVINAAGLYADSISSMLEKSCFNIAPRRGEYLLFDKSQGHLVNRVIFQPPTRMGKGILVIPTVEGNLLIGPNANDIEAKDDFSTTASGLDEVVKGALKSVPSINLREVVTSFAGLRAVSSTGDFIIGESAEVKGFINVAGIESPGLTSAPAIAEYVIDILQKGGLEMIENENYNPVRKKLWRFRDMDNEQIAAAINRDSAYGKIVCRCEKVSEGEIIDCIKRPAGARDLDGVKRRTRAGMGRCQGGFCTPRVVEILSRELGIPMGEVTKSGYGSGLLAGRTK